MYQEVEDMFRSKGMLVHSARTHWQLYPAKVSTQIGKKSSRLHLQKNGGLEQRPRGDNLPAWAIPYVQTVCQPLEP